MEQHQQQILTLIMGLSGAAPEEFIIFPLGQVTGTGMDPFTVDEGSVQSVAANHQAKGVDTVIDYEHQTLTGDVAPAAGWVKGFFLKGGGLACKVDWTARAKDYIAAKEYRYFSPVVGLDKNRRLVAIQSIALTNLPKGHNIVPLAMKAIGAIDEPSKTSEVKERSMKKILAALSLPDDTSEDKAVEVMKSRIDGTSPSLREMKALLVLPDGATSAEIMGAIKGLKEAPVPVACLEVMGELGLQAGVGKSEVIANIRALKQSQMAGINVEEFTRMKAQLANQTASGLVEEAMKAGKITAAQKDWATNYAKTDPEGFKLFIKMAPVVVVMKEIGAGDGVGGKGGQGNAGAAEITETDQIVMKQMGLSEEEFKKYYKPVTA